MDAKLMQSLVDRLERVADLQARILVAQCEVEGLRAENFSRAQSGHTIAYGEDAFFKVIEQNQLSYPEVQKHLNPK